MSHPRTALPSNARSTVAIVGPGSVGLAFAGWLASAGHRVLLCGRPGSPAVEQVVLNERDRVRSPRVEWTALDSADEPADAPGPVDVVVMAAKLYQTGTATWLDQLVGPQTLVLVAQNGVDHRDRLARWAPADRVTPVIVRFNAHRTGPGEVDVTRSGIHATVGDDRPGRAARALLTAAGLDVETVSDIVTACWQKLLANAVANPITALTLRGVEVLEVPGVRALTVQMLDEVARVGRAEGAALAEDAAADVMGWLDALPVGAGSSMLDDRLAGRPLEHEALLGTVVQAADRHGIDAPVCQVVLALITAVDGRRLP